MTDSQAVVVVVAVVGGAAGLGAMVWAWVDSARRTRERLSEGERLPRPTVAWPKPLPPLRLQHGPSELAMATATASARVTMNVRSDVKTEPPKRYVPPVNGAVRVRPGGIVRPTEPERWDLYVPPSPVSIPEIPSAPRVPSFPEYEGKGGHFGGGGASGAFESTSATVHESGVHSVCTHDGGGGSDGGGGCDSGGGSDVGGGMD